METNDRMLDQFLFHNRISPTPEFSAQIDRFCEQLSLRKERAGHARRAAFENKRRKRGMRWLAPVAAVIAAAVIVFSIPSVSQAIGNWLSSAFRISDYMAVEPDLRESNGDLADAVQTPIPTGNQATIRFLDETDYIEEVNQWRAENGHSEFDRSEYAWVNDLNPKVSELLYDGRNLVVNTELTASAERFIGTFGGDGERYDIWTNSIEVLINGEEYTAYTDQGGGLALQSLFSKDGSNGFDMDAVRAATSVTEQTTLLGNQAPAFPSGPVTVTIEMWLMDGRIDDMSTVGLVAIITQELTFDSTEGNGKLGDSYAVTQQLSGTAPITLHWADGSVENTMFDFASVTVTANVSRRTTGISVKLHYSFANEPDQAYWDAIVPGATGGHGLQYEALVNDRSIGKVWHTANQLGLREDPGVEIPLTESELESVHAIVLHPWVRYMSSYSTDGELYEEMPFDQKLYLNEFHDFYTETVLKNCDIVIPLP